jgi:hypothetical protein
MKFIYVCVCACVRAREHCDIPEKRRYVIKIQGLVITIDVINIRLTYYSIDQCIGFQIDSLVLLIATDLTKL